MTYLNHAYNTKKNTLVVNIPTEAEVFELNLKDKSIKTHYAGSKQFEEIKLQKVNAPSEKDFKLLIEKHYASIYYDEYRDIYLRFVKIKNPKKLTDYDEHPMNLLSAIILDNEFNKIGEFEFDESHLSPSLIINKEGAFYLKSTDNESILAFTRFELKEK